MGQPKFSKKKYETPNHPWKETRIKAENTLVAKYGLKNKREIWKAETVLRKYRGQARELLAKATADEPQAKKETKQLLMRLTRYDILPLNSTLDDVLALDSERILGRRLQTLTYLKGLATTPKHARQLINHGHISIEGRCVNVPGYKVNKEEESKIEYTLDSALNDNAHPARPSGDFVSKITPIKDQAMPAQPTPTKQPVSPKPEKAPSEKKDGKPGDDKKPEGTPKEPERKKDEEVKKAPEPEKKQEEKPETSTEQSVEKKEEQKEKEDKKGSEQ